MEQKQAPYKNVNIYKSKITINSLIFSFLWFLRNIV